VEGLARSARLLDPAYGAADVSKHFGSRNAERVKTLRYQPFVAALVEVGLSETVVSIAIDLKNYPRSKTDKVENERPRRMLSSKLEAAGPSAQFRPQPDFRRRHRLAQLARSSDRRTRTRQHRASPSVSASPSHLPVPGRNLHGESE